MAPAQCHMWVECVVGSRLAPRLSLGFPVFLPPEKKKNIIPKFQFDHGQDEIQLTLM